MMPKQSVLIHEAKHAAVRATSLLCGKEFLFLWVY